MIGRIRWWFTFGKHCKHCCLFCKNYDECKLTDTKEVTDNG